MLYAVIFLAPVAILICHDFLTEIGKYAMDDPPSWDGPETLTRSANHMNF